jgi:hypothetical protein
MLGRITKPRTPAARTSRRVAIPQSSRKEEEQFTGRLQSVDEHGCVSYTEDGFTIMVDKTPNSCDVSIKIGDDTYSLSKHLLLSFKQEQCGKKANRYGPLSVKTPVGTITWVIETAPVCRAIAFAAEGDGDSRIRFAA